MKRITFTNGNHSEMFSKKHLQSDDFITPKHSVQIRNTHKSFTFDTRRQSKALENITYKQSSNVKPIWHSTTITATLKTNVLSQLKNPLKNCHQVQPFW